MNKESIRHLNERDLHILVPLVEKELKKVRKMAQTERSHFGKGYAFDELESYLELMLEDFKKVLELPEFKQAFEERMKRIGKL